MSSEELRDNDPSDLDRATTRHVRRAVDGDGESLTWIVSHFSPALLAQARYRLSQFPAGLCEPEDIVQEVWLSALPRLPALPPRDGRYTPVLIRFLSTILLRRISDLGQKHLQGKPARARPAQSPSGEMLDPLHDASAQATGVVSQAVRSEVGVRIRSGIEELSESDREILVLRGIEQNANQTVALLLGIEPNTVSARYRRALQRLRKVVPGSLFDELD